VCDFYFRGEAFREERGTGSQFCDINNDGFDELLLCSRFAKDFRGAVYIWWGGKDFDGNRPADIVLA
ncbi:MAG: hypothetical protein ABH950_01730, partial [Candidatus Altiarchaeota archaeon]